MGERFSASCPCPAIFRPESWFFQPDKPEKLILVTFPTAGGSGHQWWRLQRLVGASAQLVSPSSPSQAFYTVSSLETLICLSLSVQGRASASQVGRKFRSDLSLRPNPTRILKKSNIKIPDMFLHFGHLESPTLDRIASTSSFPHHLYIGRCLPPSFHHVFLCLAFP